MPKVKERVTEYYSKDRIAEQEKTRKQETAVASIKSERNECVLTHIVITSKTFVRAGKNKTKTHGRCENRVRT
jgi:hypothetical protein